MTIYGPPGNQNHQIFRVGETCLSQRGELPAGYSDGSFQLMFTPPKHTTFDVSAVIWDLFVSHDEDMYDLLYSGDLRWDFGVAGVENSYVSIGPLSHHDGNPIDNFLSRYSAAGKDELEYLARVGDEIEWRKLFQENQLSNGRLFKGQRTYRKTPVCIPPGRSVFVVLSIKNYTLKGRLRFTVSLEGAFKTAIEIS